MDSNTRIFRIIKETRGEESRYFPQYKYKTPFLSFTWFYHFVEGNDWQYWMAPNGPSFVGEFISFVPLMFETREEAEAYLARQRLVDNEEHQTVIA